MSKQIDLLLFLIYIFKILLCTEQAGEGQADANESWREADAVKKHLGRIQRLQGGRGKLPQHDCSFKGTPMPTPAHSPLFWPGNCKIKPTLPWAMFQGPMMGMV